MTTVTQRSPGRGGDSGVHIIGHRCIQNLSDMQQNPWGYQKLCIKQLGIIFFNPPSSSSRKTEASTSLVTLRRYRK